MKITRLRVKPGQNLLIEAKREPTLRIAFARGRQTMDDATA
jgi:hypothetical protein